MGLHCVWYSWRAVCFWWARDLYGQAAGLFTLGLWSFSPNILAHFQLVSPDAAGTALGVAAAYAFWRWLRSAKWNRAVHAGVLLGLAELGKMSWIILFGLWPLLWLVDRRHKNHGRSTHAREAWQLAAILLLSVIVINVGYGFEGSFRRLDTFPFISDALVDSETPSGAAPGRGTAFRTPGWGVYRSPFRRTTFWESTFRSGILSEKCGPIFAENGDLGAGGTTILRLGDQSSVGDMDSGGAGVACFDLLRGYRAGWRNELVVLAPALAILWIVSSQTGFSCHMRYVLPIFPFLFVWISKVGKAIDLGHRVVAMCAGIAVAWSVASSLSVYPHSLSYFNELVGGPRGGPANLLDSNIDWGQDLRYLQRWRDSHPEVDALGLTYSGIYDPSIVGLKCGLPPRGPEALWNDGTSQSDFGPLPGWYAVGVNDLFDYQSSTRIFATSNRLTWRAIRSTFTTSHVMKRIELGSS